MGYSISVKFGSEQERQKMKLFLDKNQEIINQLSELFLDAGNPPHDNTACHGEDLAYAPAKSFLLGFYGSGTPRYIWDLCAWMAVKSSVRDRQGEAYFYHDSDKMKVVQGPPDTRNTLVDEHGIAIHRRDELNIFMKMLRPKLQDEKQRELMMQLNESWQAFEHKKKMAP